MFAYLAEGISASNVESYIRECESKNIHIRSLQVIKGKEPLIRLAFEPYGFDEQLHLYSLSKSFTAVACGICFDEGLLTRDTKLCELFPDKMPAEMSDELREMDIDDLLSMQSGHGTCALPEMRWSEDSIKTFFEQPIVHKPGTTFIYSTGATCVCAAAVEKVTGKKLVDFLDEKLFSKLGIKKSRWAECRDGQTLGGIGIYLSNNDITKFGVMLKNKGVYNGVRIVSEEFVNDATSVHSIDVNNGAVDWTVGYGYQIWLNSRGGFRADGAYGQLCVVFPEKDIVVTLFGEVANVPEELTLVYKLIDTMYGADSNTESLEKLTKELYHTRKNPNGFNSEMVFEVADNKADIKQLRLFGEDLLHLELLTDYGKKEIVCGNGEYILNRVMLKNLSPTILLLEPNLDLVERLSVYAAYEYSENGIIKIILRHLDTPHVQHWSIDPINGKTDIELLVGGMLCRRLSLSPIHSED